MIFILFYSVIFKEKLHISFYQYFLQYCISQLEYAQSIISSIQAIVTMTDLKSSHNPDIEQIKEIALQEKDSLKKEEEKKSCIESLRRKFHQCFDQLAIYFECLRVYNDQKLDELRKKIVQLSFNGESLSNMNKSQASLLDERESDIDQKIQSKQPKQSKSQIKNTKKQANDDQQDQQNENNLPTQPFKFVKKYADNYDKSYSQRKKHFRYTFQEVEEARQRQYIKKEKNCWEEFKRLICCRGGNYLQDLQEAETDAISETSEKQKQKLKNNQPSFYNKRDTENNIFLFDEDNAPEQVPQEIVLTKQGRKANKNNRSALANSNQTFENQKQQGSQAKNSNENQYTRSNSRSAKTPQIEPQPKQQQVKNKQQYQYTQSPVVIIQHQITDEIIQQSQIKKSPSNTNASANSYQNVQNNNQDTKNNNEIIDKSIYHQNYTNVNTNNIINNNSSSYHNHINAQGASQQYNAHHPSNQSSNQYHQQNQYQQEGKTEQNQYINRESQHSDVIPSRQTSNITPTFNQPSSHHTNSSNNWQYQTLDNQNSVVNNNIDPQYNTIGNYRSEQHGVAKSKTEKKARMKKNLQHFGENQNEEVNSNQVVFFNDDLKNKSNINTVNVTNRNTNEYQTSFRVNKTKNSFQPEDNFDEQIILDQSQGSNYNIYNKNQNNSSNYYNTNDGYDVNHNQSASQVGNSIHSPSPNKANTNLVVRNRDQQVNGYTLDDIPSIEQPPTGAETTTFKKKKKNKKNLKQQLQLNQQFNEEHIIYQQNEISNEQIGQASHISSNLQYEAVNEKTKAPQVMLKKKKKDKRKNLVLHQEDNQQVFNLDEF